MVGKNILEIMDELMDYITFNSDKYDLFDIISFKRKDNLNDKKSDFVYNSDLQEELPEYFQNYQEDIRNHLTSLENRTNFIEDFVDKKLEKINKTDRPTNPFGWATELVLRIYEQKLTNKPDQIKQITTLRKKVVNYQSEKFDELFGSKPNNVPNWESEYVNKTKDAIVDMFINYRSELENQKISNRKILRKEKQLYKTLDKWKVLGRENQVQETYKELYENNKTKINWRKKVALVGLTGLTSFLLFPIKSEYQIKNEMQYSALQKATEQRDYASLEGDILTIKRRGNINIKLEDEDVSAMTNILKNSDFSYKTIRKIRNYFSKKIKLNEENKNEK